MAQVFDCDAPARDSVSQVKLASMKGKVKDIEDYYIDTQEFRNSMLPSIRLERFLFFFYYLAFWEKRRQLDGICTVP